MRKFLLFCSLILTCSSCAANSNFVYVRNAFVGTEVNWDPKEPPKISSHNATQDKYLFETKDGCKWVYYVNKSTKIIESWEYVSLPDKCRTGLNWFGPW